MTQSLRLCPSQAYIDTVVDEAASDQLVETLCPEGGLMLPLSD